MSQVCMLLVLLSLCNVRVSCSSSLELLKQRWAVYRNQCLEHMTVAPPSPGLVCNRSFDQYACWPDGPPGSTVNISCPWFLPWYSQVQGGLVFRACGADGRWSVKNTSECEDDSGQQQEYGRILGQFRAMYTVGYSLSLGALILALGLLLSFRKLQCIRNSIHMNLFLSFILRAAAILLKDALLDALGATPTEPRGGAVPRPPAQWARVPAGLWCRAAVVLMQYSVMANNYWLLVEGLYLHRLLVTTVFSEKNNFYVYLGVGWGAPLVFVLPWVTVKYLYENEECWERNINMGYWWIIRSPILLAYLINFFIFIRIIKILMSKLKAHQMRYTDYKFRLAKSTLTLIPLLGIHAILFTFVIDESVPKGSSLRLIRLCCDLLFNSFQGLLVAILYCFVNKETNSIGVVFFTASFHFTETDAHPKVQSQVLRRWRRWRLGKDIDEEHRLTHSHTTHPKSHHTDPLQTTQLPDGQRAAAGLAPPPSSRAAACHSRADAPYQEKRCLVVSYAKGRGRRGLLWWGFEAGTTTSTSTTSTSTSTTTTTSTSTTITTSIPHTELLDVGERGLDHPTA